MEVVSETLIAIFGGHVCVCLAMKARQRRMLAMRVKECESNVWSDGPQVFHDFGSVVLRLEVLST